MNVINGPRIHSYSSSSIVLPFCICYDIDINSAIKVRWRLNSVCLQKIYYIYITLHRKNINTSIEILQTTLHKELPALRF